MTTPTTTVVRPMYSSSRLEDKYILGKSLAANRALGTEVFAAWPADRADGSATPTHAVKRLSYAPGSGHPGIDQERVARLEATVLYKLKWSATATPATADNGTIMPLIDAFW